MSSSRRQRLHYGVFCLLVIIYVLNSVLAVPSLSTNSDEGDYFNYAVRLFKGKPDKVRLDEDASCLPISMLNAVPRAVQQLLNPSLIRSDNGVTDITNGRYLTILAGLLLGFYIYRWSKEWYGKNGALISVFLFVFCPTLGAFTTTIMTDLYAALFTIIPLYHYWKYRESGSFQQFLFFATTLAMAQLAKQSLSHLYIIFLVLWIVPILAGQSRFANWRKMTGRLLIIVALQLVVINAGFQFRHFGNSLSTYNFRSTAFQSLKSKLGPISEIPLPLPTPYLDGIDENMHLVELGPGVKIAAADNYLFGEKKRSQFYYYYLTVIFFKTPIVSLISMALALFLLIRRLNADFWRNEFLVIFPVAYFLSYFSIVLNIQGGIRFILMIFPLLFVVCGRIAGELQLYADKEGTNLKLFWRPALGVIAIGWLMINYYQYWPNLIPFTNEFIPNKKMAYRVMGDSNLDNGQAQYYLASFISKNPGCVAAPLQPAAGKFYIGVNELLDLYDEGRYEWLFGNFKPVSHVGHSFLIFEINPAQLKDKTGIAN